MEEYTPNRFDPIQQRAPGWLARGVVYLLLLLLVAAVGWSAISRIDVSSRGDAMVIPDGRVRAIQTPVKGVVESVSVVEGQSVVRGELLAIISAEEIRDQQRQLEVSRQALNALESEEKEVLPLRVDLAERTRLANSEEIVQLEQRIQIIRQQLEGLTREESLQEQSSSLVDQRFKTEKEKLNIDRKNARLTEALRKSELKTRRNLGQSAVSQEEVFRYEQEANKAGNDVVRLDTEIRQLDTEKALRKNEARIERERMNREHRSAQDSILALAGEVSQLQKAILVADSALLEYRSTLSRKLTLARTALENQRRRLSELLGGAELRAGSNVFEVRAPVDGVVAVANILHPGEVIESGSPLFSLVPRDVRLVAEIQVTGTGSGRIAVGQRVKYRFDAFPAAQFGILQGEVEKVLPQVEPNRQGNGTVLRVIASLDQLYFTENNNQFALKPGLAANAEIVTDRQSVLSLLFQPIKALASRETVNQSQNRTDNVADN